MLTTNGHLAGQASSQPRFQLHHRVVPEDAAWSAKRSLSLFEQLLFALPTRKKS